MEEGKKQKVTLPNKITRNINSKTIPAFCKILKSASWSNVLKENNPELAFNNFFEIMDSSRDIAFPEITVKQKPVRFKHNPWITYGLKVSQKRKELLFAKKLKCPTESNLQQFKMYNTIYNKLRRAAKRLYYDKQFEKFAKNSKQTWSVIREVIGSCKQKDQIPTFFKQNGELIFDTMEIVKGFNNFFTGVGPELAADIEPSDITFERFLIDNNNANTFTFAKISEIDILNICKELKPKLSSGEDFISTKLLKHIAPIIITPLHYLINLSLEKGFVPKQLKLAKVIPV